MTIHRVGSLNLFRIYWDRRVRDSLSSQTPHHNYYENIWYLSNQFCMYISCSWFFRQVSVCVRPKMSIFTFKIFVLMNVFLKFACFLHSERSKCKSDSVSKSKRVNSVLASGGSDDKLRRFLIRSEAQRRWRVLEGVHLIWGVVGCFRCEVL